MANPSSSLQDIKEEDDDENALEVSIQQIESNLSVRVSDLPAVAASQTVVNDGADAANLVGDPDTSVLVKQPELESHILGLVLEDETGEKLGGNSIVADGARNGEVLSDDELLLPPLPDVETKTALVYHEENNDNFSSNSSSAGGSLENLSPVLDSKPTDKNETPFDLSQALEIPTNSTTSSSTQNTSAHATQSLLSPSISSPKMALKRRISNSLLSQTLNQETLLLSTGSSPQIIQTPDFPLHKTSTVSSEHASLSSSGTKNKSRSNSNAVPTFSAFENASSSISGGFNIPSALNNNTNGGSLKNVNNGTVTNAYNILYNTNTTEVSDKRFADLKKIAVTHAAIETASSSSGISSTSSNSPLERTHTGQRDELLYKPPSTLASLRASSEATRSRSNSHLNVITNFFSDSSKTQQHTTPDDASDNYSLGSSEINIPKRLPLLRRASSALLRKRSLRQNDNSTTDLTNLSQRGSSPVNELRVASLDLDAIARLESRNKKNLFINTNDSRNTLSTRESVTSLRSGLGSDPNLVRMPSFGSKVKRGFTRIISSGNASSRKESPTEAGKNQSRPSESDSISMNFGLDTNSVNEFVAEHYGNKDNVLRKRSSSAFQQKRASRLNKRSSNTNSIVSDRGNSGSIQRTRSTTQREAEDAAEMDEHDLIISDADMELLSKKLPTITITEKFGANNTTPLQQQSNVWYYKTSFDEWKNATNKKPSNDSLKKYIDILIEQQTLEDTRFQALEHNFKQSGWVSSQELGYLRQKRVIINRQWAERISFYQNKLDG